LNAKVAAVFVGGSSARGHADRFSDVEVGVFWKAPPTEADRRAAIERAGCEFFRSHPYDATDSVWPDDLLFGPREDDSSQNGFLVEVSNHTTDFFESALQDLLVRHEPSDLNQSLVSSVLYGIPVYGTALLESWSSAAKNYPDGLALAVIRRHARIENFWRFEVMLERNLNLLMVNDIFCRAAKQLLRVLLGLNRVYYFGFKWLDFIASLMPLAPPDLVSRLRYVFTADAPQGGIELAALVEETYQLVGIHFPQVDTESLRQTFRSRPLAWSHPPTGWGSSSIA
jgi:hypothetical protein